MNLLRQGGLLLLSLFLVGCTSTLPDPVPLASQGGVLDLRSWNFTSRGPVVPLGWVWDAGVLWSPDTGRPETLPPPAAVGAPDRGGTFSTSLRHQTGTREAVATAQITILVPSFQGYALQVGAVHGRSRVWVNGVAIWDSGARGAGALLTVQPRDGRIDVVAQLRSSDPLILHSELNRLWVIGPDLPMLAADRAERTGRLIQATCLFLGVLLFLGMAWYRPDRQALWPFSLFLFVCFLKLLFHVEQAAPLFALFQPGIPTSVFLFLNHGLNLLPFPLMTLFLVRQFPEEVSFPSFLVMAGATLVATVWELLPFVALAWGNIDFYQALMRTPWAFFLNLYVVVAVLFIFERSYATLVRGRPLAWALFFGGIGVGLLVLLPIVLSYFFQTKYTLFMGWGLLFYLALLGFELVRLQIEATRAQLRRLTQERDQSRLLGQFLAPAWPQRLGKASVADLKPGDRKEGQAVFVRIQSPDPVELWLPSTGRAAGARGALLASWSEGTGIWVLNAWPEGALAFALEVQRQYHSLQGLRYRIVLAPGLAEYQLLDGGDSWLPTIAGVPRDRLEQLDQVAESYGASLVLDEGLREGLAIGGWRRHRPLTPAGTEIELYEVGDPSLAEIKDRTLDAFGAALALAREGRFDQAVRTMVSVLRLNPFDQAALNLLREWEAKAL